MICRDQRKLFGVQVGSDTGNDFYYDETEREMKGTTAIYYSCKLLKLGSFPSSENV